MNIELTKEAKKVKENRIDERNTFSSLDGNALVKWERETIQAFLSGCMTALNYSAKRDLERRVRSGTGTEEKGRLTQCCANYTPPTSNHVGCSDSVCKTCSGREEKNVNEPFPYIFKKDENDYLGGILDTWMKQYKFLEILPAIAEKCSDIYYNVITKGKASGMELANDEEEKQLRFSVLRETIIRQIQLAISKQIIDERCMDSQEGGLLANPVGYDDGTLSLLNSETVRNLMIDGVAIQDNIMGDDKRSRIYNEIELLEYDNRMNEVLNQNANDVRTDHMCWITASDLDRERHTGLLSLFKVMSSLPFELNMKAKLGLQISWVFQIAYYSNNGARYNKHMDGGYDKNSNNGRKITCIYYPNSDDWKDSDGGILRLYKRQSMKYQQSIILNNSSFTNLDEIQLDVLPKGDRLVLFRSRDMPHEVTPTFRKRFAVSLWLNGPVGPGDDF